jgi:hypothetical protein
MRQRNEELSSRVRRGYTKPYYGPYQVPILGTPTMLVGYDIGANCTSKAFFWAAFRRRASWSS